MRATSGPRATGTARVLVPSAWTATRVVECQFLLIFMVFRGFFGAGEVKVLERSNRFLEQQLLPRSSFFFCNEVVRTCSGNAAKCLKLVNVSNKIMRVPKKTFFQEHLRSSADDGRRADPFAQRSCSEHRGWSSGPHGWWPRVPAASECQSYAPGWRSGIPAIDEGGRIGIAPRRGSRVGIASFRPAGNGVSQRCPAVKIGYCRLVLCIS